MSNGQSAADDGAVSRTMHIPFEAVEPQSIAQHIRTAEAADPAVGIAMLREATARMPQAADGWFALGGMFDSNGRPKDAVPCYERALALRPDAGWSRYAHLQLASSYRNTGRLEAARELLAQGVERFPDFHVLRVFQAYVAHDLGAHTDALRTLVDLLLTVAPQAADPYRRAVAGYKEDL